MKRIPPCVLALAMTAVCSGAAEAESGKLQMHTIKNIPYYEGDDSHPVLHTLDLYLPKGQRNFPVLFFIHGGGWAFGTKGYFGLMPGFARNFTRYGVGVVSVNYRLSPQVRHPEHIRDVARAFAWTHANIERYGGCKQQIFVSGHSAGGHLAALLATNESYLKEQRLTLSAIRAAVPISGVFILPNDRIFRAIFGPEVLERGDADPSRNVNPRCPPFLIVYAESEFLHCDRPLARKFYERLREFKLPAMIYEVPCRNHLSIFAAALWDTDPMVRTILGFIMGQVTMDRFATNPAQAVTALSEMISRFADRERDLVKSDNRPLRGQ